MVSIIKNSPALIAFGNDNQRAKTLSTSMGTLLDGQSRVEGLAAFGFHSLRGVALSCSKVESAAAVSGVGFGDSGRGVSAGMVAEGALAAALGFQLLRRGAVWSRSAMGAEKGAGRSMDAEDGTAPGGAVAAGIA